MSSQRKKDDTCIEKPFFYSALHSLHAITISGILYPISEAKIQFYFIFKNASKSKQSLRWQMKVEYSNINFVKLFFL